MKRSLGVGTLLNLVTSDLLPCMTVLENRKHILDLAVFGGGLHLKVDDADAAIAEIRSALAEAGIQIKTLEPITPSMEDVFVSLIEKEEAKAV